MDIDLDQPGRNEWHQMLLYHSIWNWSIWLARLLSLSGLVTIAFGLFIFAGEKTIGWETLASTLFGLLQLGLARATLRYAHNLRHYLTEGHKYSYLRLLARQRNLLAIATLTGFSFLIGLTTAALGWWI